MGGLVRRTESAVSGRLPFNSSHFTDFRTHGQRMRIDDLFASLGRFVARVSASVTTVERRPGLRVFSPVADAAFAYFFVVTPRGDQGSAEAPDAATIATQRALPPTILQGEDFAMNTAPAASAPSDPGSAGAPAAAATIVAQSAPPPTSTSQEEDSATSIASAASALSGQGSAAAPATVTTAAQGVPPRTSALQGEDYSASITPAASALSDQGSAAAPAAATNVAQGVSPPTSTLQRNDSAVITDPVMSAPSSPGNLAPLNTLPPPGHISTRTPRRTAADAGSAPPAVDYGFGPGGASRQFNPACYHPAASPTAATSSTSRFGPGSCRFVGPDGTYPVRMRPHRARGNSSLTASAADGRTARPHE